MKPGTLIIKDTTVHVDHDVVVKGTKNKSSAKCYTCLTMPIEEFSGAVQDIFPIIATGSRHHVNRQVRIHRSKR